MTNLTPDVPCPQCNMPITAAQALDVAEDMEFESRFCPVCCRTYWQAQQEESARPAHR